MFRFVREMVISPKELSKVLGQTPDTYSQPLIRLCFGSDVPPAGISRSEWIVNHVRKEWFRLTYPTPAFPDNYAREVGGIVIERYPEVYLEGDDPHLWDIVERVIQPAGFEMNMITCLEARTGSGVHTMAYEYRPDTKDLSRYLTDRTIEMLEDTLQQMTIWIASPGSPIVYTFEHFQDTGHCTARVVTDVPFPDWYLLEKGRKKETKWLTVMFTHGDESYFKDREGGFYKSTSFEGLSQGITSEFDMELFSPIGRYIAHPWSVPYISSRNMDEGYCTYLIDLDSGTQCDVLYRPSDAGMYSESGTLWVREDVLDAEYNIIASYYYPV